LTITLESLSPVHKKFKKFANRFQKKEEEEFIDKAKIKSRLKFSTEENKDRDEYKGRKVALFLLRRLAKKLKGGLNHNQDNDGDRRITEEDESDQNIRLNEPQYGGGPDEPQIMITDNIDLDDYLLNQSYESQQKVYT
jgi:hypothetical protein